LGDVLVGAGVAAVAVGGVFFMSANSDAQAATNDVNDHKGYAAYQSDAHASDHAALVGVIAAGAGALLVTGGILHYALRPSASGPQVDVGLAPGGAFASLGGVW
jgi:hypothetical protein